MILNCENMETALASLSEFFGCQAALLQDFLQGMDLDELYEKQHSLGTPILIDPQEVIGELVAERFGSPKIPDVVYWFHYTRVLPGTTFKEGLLPLDQVLEHIWDVLEHIFVSSPLLPRIRTSRRSQSATWMYRHKLSMPSDYGPHGMLFGDLHENRRCFSLSNFLRVPEIIDDILGMFSSTDYEDAMNLVHHALVPCVVTFQAPSRYPTYIVHHALLYVNASLRGESLTYAYSYDGPSCVVPPEKIVRVRWLDANASLQK